MVHAKSSWGGNIAITLALCKGLIAQGFRVVLAAPGNQPYIPHFEREGVPIKKMSIGGKKDMLAPLRLARYALEEKFDIIHSHTRPADFAALLAAKMLHKPSIISQHGNVNLDRKTLSRRHDLPAFIYNMVLRNATRNIAVSHATANELTNKCGVSRSIVKVIYNGLSKLEKVDYSAIRERKRAELGIKPNQVLGLIVGTIIWKGHEVLAQSIQLLAREHPEFVVLAAGDNCDPTIQATIKTLGIEDRMILLGFRDDVKDLLAAADIFILPSRSEAFPLVILEAMQMGLPVVASAIGGIPEQVQDGCNGLLTSVGNVGGLTTALKLLIEDGNLRSAMGEAGRELAQTFSYDRMLANYIEMYKEVLNQTPS